MTGIRMYRVAGRRVDDLEGEVEGAAGIRADERVVHEAEGAHHKFLGGAAVVPGGWGGEEAVQGGVEAEGVCDVGGGFDEEAGGIACLLYTI